MVKRILSPVKNPPAHDIVYTPRPLAKEIIDFFVPTGKILDPCKGDGAFYDQYPEECIKDWCEISQGRDFFVYRNKVDWIITNPPWSKIRYFIKHGMEISDNIVYLIAVIHCFTTNRTKMIFQNGFGFKTIYGLLHPDRADWPSSGFQLAAVHIQRGWQGDCKFTGIFDSWKKRNNLIKGPDIRTRLRLAEERQQLFDSIKN